MSVYIDFVETIRGQLARKGISVRAAAISGGLPIRSVQGIIEGHVPSIERAGEVAKVLGLEFYIGPPRGELTMPEVADATPDGAPDWAAKVVETQEGLRDSLQAELAALKAKLALVLDLIPSTDLSEDLSALRTGLREDLAASIQKLTEDLSDETATAVEGSPSRPVVTYELAAAAGGGAMELDETPTGIVYFRHDWLTQHGLDAKQCCVMGVVGESMETMLPDGCAILVNRRPGIRRRVDHLYVVINDLGLIVKRAGKDEDGQWLLVSDHPAWEPVPWGDAQMIGEVKWMARTL